MIWWEEALVIDDRLVPLRGHLDEEVCDLVLILLQIYIYIYTYLYASPTFGMPLSSFSN